MFSISDVLGPDGGRLSKKEAAVSSGPCRMENRGTYQLESKIHLRWQGPAGIDPPVQYDQSSYVCTHLTNRSSTGKTENFKAAWAPNESH